MYVYVRNGNIIHVSNSKVDFLKDADVYGCWFSLSDNLIFEDWKVKIYEKSNQFDKDIHKYHLKSKIHSLEFQNGKLEKIANQTVKNDMELKRETTKFDRELYLLKQLKKWWWQS
jgi:hypothetical protein